MGKRLTYTLSLPADLREQTIPPMLLQPLVENAIKHGLEPKINGGNIHVAAENDAHFLYLTVKDTGLGLSAPHAASPETHHAGLGLGNINLRERLQALFGPSAAFTLKQISRKARLHGFLSLLSHIHHHEYTRPDC
jgi:sensor histidine kinase YesM